MHHNLYDILGLHKDATHHEIKAAYRKLALIYHPDRKSWCKETDEIQFKKLSDAYQVLSDPTKKDLYDFDLMLSHNFNLISPFFIQVCHSILNFLSTSHHSASKREKPYASHPNSSAEPTCKSSAVSEQKVRQKIPDELSSMNQQDIGAKKTMSVIVDMEVTLDDLYLHKIKRMLVSVKRRHKNGETMSRSRETIYVSLMNHQTVYLFSGIGDDSVYADIQRGDICVNLKIKPHDHIAIDTVISKYDLWMTIPISLYEYYFGTRIEMPYLGGEFLDETIVWETKSDALLHEIPGYGLPYLDEAGNFCRGLLIISCRIDLPSRIDPDLDLQAIREILKCHFGAGDHELRMFGETHPE